MNIKGVLTPSNEFSIKGAITAHSITLGGYEVKLEPVDGGAQLSVIRGNETQTLFIPNGESVTIDEIIESTDDGEKIIVFSDGTRLTIPTGKDGSDGFSFVPSIRKLNEETIEFNFLPTRTPNTTPHTEMVTLPKGDKGDPGKYYTVDMKYLGDGKIQYTRIPSDPNETTTEEIFDLTDHYDAIGGNIATDQSLGLVKVGDNLVIDENGTLSVDTADDIEQDNTRPITSAAVYNTVGNIEILLKTI